MDKITYSVSVRGKPAREPVGYYMEAYFPKIPVSSVDSVFGFAERSTLYGGREFRKPQLTDGDCDFLYEHGSGVKLPLSNHFVSEAEYEQNQPFLEKYHRKGNQLVIVNDDLARWVRRDYPDYSPEASVIKDIRTHDDIGKALEIYDTVVLPMDVNNDIRFLKSIEDKSRIRLFMNAGCAYKCPLKLCYKSFSRLNKFTGDATFQCSQSDFFRTHHEMVEFDVDRLFDLGFHKFKVLRPKGNMATAF
jgi:hypothetical protein